jgi:tetratricopeptide (TPR) repeat protein
VVCLVAAVTLRDGRRFHDDEALWGPEIAARPQCREGQFYAGESHRARGEWDAAATRYQRAAAPQPGYLAYADRVAALQNLGAVRVAQGRLPDAESAFRAALDETSDEDTARRRRLNHNLATVALRRGRADEAASLLETEAQRPDALRESLFVRAHALHALGRNQEASELELRLAAF